MDSLKTIWKEKNDEGSWRFFCPQCKVPRCVPYRPRPGLRHYLQVALTSVVFMLLAWKEFSWKGAVVFVPIWTVFEIVYRSNLRAALSCENCGFDPVLYLVDTKLARREIERHWKKKFEDKGIPYPQSPAVERSGEKNSERGRLGDFL